MHRAQLIQAHRALAAGSPDDMRAAKLVLYLLRKGSICLGFGDIEHEVELLLEGIGLRARYSRNYNTAYFHI